jgi:hypothetical protein
MARANQRSPITQSVYAIRPESQSNEVFGTDRGYWKEFEELTRGGMYTTHVDWFIYNPAGVLAASQLRVSSYRGNRAADVIMTLMMLSL